MFVSRLFGKDVVMPKQIMITLEQLKNFFLGNWKRVQQAVGDDYNNPFPLFLTKDC